MHLDLGLSADNRITIRGRFAPALDWMYGYRPVMPHVHVKTLRYNRDTSYWYRIVGNMIAASAAGSAMVRT
jgi:hypothetical protein